MEESKKVNTEYFKKKIGNTTYRVRVHFPQNTKRTFTDRDFSKEDRQKASLSIAIPAKYEDEIYKLYPTDIFRHLRCL